VNKPSFYGLCKDLLSAGMIVNYWWKKPYNLRELTDAFGTGALQRGIKAAQERGETVPQEAIDAVFGVQKEELTRANYHKEQ